MLKSTYNAVVPQAVEESPLPPGWSEHKAPTGHSYYYHAETKQSTYTRPSVAPPADVFLNPIASTPSVFSLDLSQGAARTGALENSPGFRGGLSYQDRSRRNHPPDRPKKKRDIPGCEPWVLVTTKLGRRFVYNPEKDESFWKFPQDVLLATFEMDRREQEQREDPERASSNAKEVEQPRPATSIDQSNHNQGSHETRDSDSYEEVEVTDDEDMNPEDADGEGHISKKSRTETATEAGHVGPIDFNEEDMAYQLAQMGEDYGLDPGEYGNEEGEDYDKGLRLSLEDCRALFHDLLSDHAVDPYSTWDRIVEDGRIVEDERYVVLPNMRARKAAFTSWSAVQIQRIQERRAREKKQNPRIAYLQLLHQHATPKLYWPEFKRKHRKADAMKDPGISDKDRERMYRDHINRLKLPESTRKSDLKDLLRGDNHAALDHSTTIETLPTSILIDLRFISLASKTRDPLVEAYISTHRYSSSASTTNHPATASDEPATRTFSTAAAADAKRATDALREREQFVQAEKRRAREKLEQSRQRMREEEREIDQAMRVRGKQGLRGYMETEKELD